VGLELLLGLALVLLLLLLSLLLFLLSLVVCGTSRSSVALVVGDLGISGIILGVVSDLGSLGALDL